MSYLRYLCLFAYSGVQHIVLCFCFVFLRIVYSMLPVSLFFFVLCTLCCQFLCFSSYCVLYVASFSRLSSIL
jgi:hypothetical protein